MIGLLTKRRYILQNIGLGVATTTLGASQAGAQAATGMLVPPAGATLAALTARLAATPRRRQFTALPMILNNHSQWDYEAFATLISYQGGPKQVWDNVNIAGDWLGFMRNAMNSEIWSFGHPDFCCVSATHGSAHFAIYDEFIWNKYEIKKAFQGKIDHHKILGQPIKAPVAGMNYEDTKGNFSAMDNSIITLQQRGAVFLACHNAIWEFASLLIKAGNNPDKLSQESLTAELTNHLIPGIIHSPASVGSVVELQNAGFLYAKS